MSQKKVPKRPISPTYSFIHAVVCYVTYGTSVGTELKQFSKCSFKIKLDILEFQILLKMLVFDLWIVKIFSFPMFGWILAILDKPLSTFIRFDDFS